MVTTIPIICQGSLGLFAFQVIVRLSRALRLMLRICTSGKNSAPPWGVDASLMMRDQAKPGDPVTERLPGIGHGCLLA